jgi:hypothetical protein
VLALLSVPVEVSASSSYVTPGARFLRATLGTLIYSATPLPRIWYRGAAAAPHAVPARIEIPELSLNISVLPANLLRDPVVNRVFP